MPRAPRGRHRGHHRRPKTHHLPAAIGSIALATAAAGALTVGAPASAASVGSTPNAAVVEPPQIDPRPVLDPDAAAAVLAIRAEGTAERSIHRQQHVTSVLRADAEQELAAAASLDALAGDRLVRFADVPTVWFVPVEGYRLTSLYGPRWGRSHDGLDLAAPSGTPIRAMAAGVIISAQYESGYGNRTVIRHEDGTETWYCHQSAFEVTSGAVEGGQLIGYVGSTGNSTGPHLHLEVHPGGGDASINPLSWMRDVLGLTV